jgi:hypothetical protein
MRRAVVTLAGVVLALAGPAGCGDGVRDERPGSALSDPGTPLGEGMMVPQETQLVGPVFSRPSRDGDLRSGLSVLAVEGDPFVIWDGLSYQAHQLGAPLPGSAVCAWYETAPPPGASLRQPVPVSEPKPEGMERLACSASASGTSPDGEHIGIVADLTWSSEGAEVGLEITGGGPPGPTRAFPEPDPGPAPPGTAALLPVVGEPPAPRSGDEFGPETNCAEAGYIRLRLPAHARLASRGGVPLASDRATVLSVSDPGAVLDDIAAQLDPTGPDAGEGTATVERVDLAYGKIWRLTADVGAGGGSCVMWSSSDGTAVLMMVHND